MKPVFHRGVWITAERCGTCRPGCALSRGCSVGNCSADLQNSPLTCSFAAPDLLREEKFPTRRSPFRHLDAASGFVDNWSGGLDNPQKTVNYAQVDWTVPNDHGKSAGQRAITGLARSHQHWSTANPIGQNGLVDVYDARSRDRGAERILRGDCRKEGQIHGRILDLPAQLCAG